MRLLISPTEPPEIKALGRTSSKPERYGADVMWFSRRRRFGVQRKRFPEDFMASLNDGRLTKEAAQMGALDGRFLIVEGFGTWTDSGHLLESPFTKGALFALFTTLHIEFGVLPIRVRDLRETLMAVEALAGWTTKDRHVSLLVRPGPPRDKWGQRTNKAWGMHLLQSFSGIGPVQAEAIYEHFGGVPLQWTVSDSELAEVAGIGPKRIESMKRALR